MEIVHQLIAEVLRAKYDGLRLSSWLGKTQRMVPSPDVAWGGWRGDIEERLGDMRDERCQGGGEEKHRVNLRYKRRDNMNRFIKKTVVPYPRLG